MWQIWTTAERPAEVRVSHLPLFCQRHFILLLFFYFLFPRIHHTTVSCQALFSESFVDMTVPSTVCGCLTASDPQVMDCLRSTRCVPTNCFHLSHFRLGPASLSGSTGL